MTDLLLPTWFDDEVVEAPDLGDDHVVLRLGLGRYGLAAADVAEVVAMPRLTRLPGAAPWLRGLANWRGHVLPVLDLRPLLDVPTVPLATSARLVVLAVDDVEVGVVAEAVLGLVPVDEACAPVPAALAPSAADLTVGLADVGPAGPVVVLGTSALLGLGRRVTAPRAGRNFDPVHPFR